MDEKLKNELRQLENPLAVLKAQIDQVCLEIKLRPLKKNDTEAEDALIRSFGVFKTGVKLAGYPIEKVAVPSSTNPMLSVQAAYNLWAALDYTNKKAIEGGTSYADLALDKEEIKTALMKAISFLLIPGSDIVVDEATAKLAKAYSEFFQKITRQSEGIYSRLSDDSQEKIKRKIKKNLEKKSPKGTKINKKTVEEKTIEIMDLVPKNMTMLGTLFEMAECRYRMQQFSKEIEALSESPVLDKQIELRQKLLDILPESLRGDMPEEFNEAFFVQYKAKGSEYLEVINNTKKLNDLDTLSGIEISTKFDKERSEFKKEFPTFLNQTLTKLEDKIAPKQQLVSQIEMPPLPVKEETTPPPEVPVESVIKKEVGEATTVTVEEGELEEVKEKETAPSPPAPVEEPVKELSWDVKELQQMIEDSNKNLKEQENKIQTLDIKFNELDSKLKVLSDELNNFTIESTRLRTQQKQLLEESDRLKKWFEQEEPATREELPKRQMDLATQRESIKKLREDIRSDRLVLDAGTHKDALGWLGLSEEGLKDYLDAQEQETAIFGGARAAASNWWKSAWGEEVKPAIDYKAANAKFLESLNNADEGVIRAQKELEKQVELLNQQMVENQKQLEALNIPLGSVEKEIETLKPKITDKTALKTQIENDKKQTEEEKKALEADKKELLEWKERLDEHKKLVDAEEERKKLKADQLEKTNPLEQKVEKVEEFVKESAEQTIVPPLNEPTPLSATTGNLVEPPIFKISGGLHKAEKDLEEKKNALNEAKELYNMLGQKYEESKGLSKVPVLLDRIKAFFKYLGAKYDLEGARSNLKEVIKQETKQRVPPSPVIFPPPAKVSPGNVEMAENQKNKKPGSSSSTPSIKEGR